MRIVYVSHYALPHVGGIEVVIDGLARELVRRGHEVVHIASRALREGEAGAEERPYRLVSVPAFNGLETRLDVPYPIFAPALRGVLARELAQADVVHGHGFLYMSTVAAARRARRMASQPVRVLSEHVGHVDYDSRVLDQAQRLAIRTIGRHSVRMAQATVVLNTRVEAELRALVPDARIVTIPNGVDTEAYRPAGDDERRALRAALGWDERPRALFVGRMVAKKGLAAALDAARAGGFELAVAGPGDAPRDLPANVTVLGRQTRERVAELYRAADVLLLPSRGEGFPLVAQEALASGLPIILGDDPAYAGYGDADGVAVTLVAPEGRALADAVARVLAQADAGAAAARHARERFSWAAAAGAHEALYEQLHT